MEGEVPQGGLWAAAATIIGSVIWGVWHYIMARAGKTQTSAPSQSPIGDVRVFGAALNDSKALHRIAEATECACEEVRQSHRRLDRLIDALRTLCDNYGHVVEAIDRNVEAVDRGTKENARLREVLDEIRHIRAEQRRRGHPED